jgi:ABC-type transport system substrate-binding protein
LAEEGLAAADDAEAKQIYDEIERTVIAEKACYVPLYDQVVTWGSRGVTGFKLLPVTLVDYYPLAKS